LLSIKTRIETSFTSLAPLDWTHAPYFKMMKSISKAFQKVVEVEKWFIHLTKPNLNPKKK
jgi:hypothetical protein